MDRTNGRLDAAIIAYRDNPTPDTYAALALASEEHNEGFLLEQTIEFQARTHMRGAVEFAEYIDPAKASGLRVFREPCGVGHQWSVDAANESGYTEEVWSFPTWAEAVAAMPKIAAKVAPHLLRV